jgi:hypothetical protein
LPLPEGPSINTPRSGPKDTALAWTTAEPGGAVSGGAHSGRPTTKRAPSGATELSVGVGGLDVLGPDHPAMRLDDLLRDGQSEARVIAELRLRAFGIEPLEDLGQGLLGDARAGILDHDQHPVLALARPERTASPVLAERDGIGDQVDEDLRQPGLQPLKISDRLVGQFADELDAPCRRFLRQVLDRLFQRLAQVKGLPLPP